MAPITPKFIPTLFRQLRSASINISPHPCPRAYSTGDLTTAPMVIRKYPTAGPEAEVPRWPTVPTCPAPTCSCAATPPGLDINRDGPMTLPPFMRHVVIRTGRSDWASRIEDEKCSVVGDAQEGIPRANLARSLKELVRPGGKYYNPRRNILITNCSLDTPPGAPNTNAVFVFPQNIYIPQVLNTPEDHDLFVRQFLMEKEERRGLSLRDTNVHEDLEYHGVSTGPNEHSAAEDGGSRPTGSTQAIKLQQPRTSRAVRRQHIEYSSGDSPTILICGHNTRDSRCGVLGPLLHKEFCSYINRQYHKRSFEKRPDGQIIFHLQESERVVPDNALKHIKISLTSHVGGHAWAGNVMIYFPATHCLQSGERSPLAGKGVWYGRVEPRHVEGIVEQTIRQGKVIEELLRGVHCQPRTRRTATTTEAY